jgi:SAM-dependent methyltransferase
VTDAYADRRRAESFGADPERYDRCRPTYPASLIDRLTAGTPGLAVDVGCGTGRVARLLLAAGWRVVGVEADERMAAVARRAGVTVEVGRFETWASPLRDVDLVCAGQAWHWVDPARGYDRAASLLRPGGRLAVFWNVDQYEPAVSAAIDTAFARHAAQLLDGAARLMARGPDRAAQAAEAIAARPDLFERPTIETFTHDRTLAVDAWIDELATHSPITVLPDDVREALFTELIERIGAVTGNEVLVRYETGMASAFRAPARP